MNKTQTMMQKALELKAIFNDELDIQGLDTVKVSVNPRGLFVKITLPVGAEIDISELQETGEQVGLRAMSLGSDKGGLAVYFHK